MKKALIIEFNTVIEYDIMLRQIDRHILQTKQARTVIVHMILPHILHDNTFFS